MNRNILVVDDSATLRASVTFSLSEAGYETVEAIDGLDALAKLDSMSSKGESVALILTDINMPRMDGINFIRELKQKPTFRFIPVLILTTESQESKKLEGKQAGAAGWLVKPFNNTQLVDVVRKFVR